MIGDVHGELRSLRRLLDHISTDLEVRPTQNFHILFLGDLIDRGENSRGVIDIAMQLVRESNTTVLRGNHEQMLLSALTDPRELLAWRQYGGLETLMSFGIAPIELIGNPNVGKVQEKLNQAVGPERKSFIESLPTSFQSGDYYFCHAGIKPGVSLAKQSEHDLMWIRDEFLSSSMRHEKYIVHGHTPVEHIDVHQNRINIDTGAYLTGRLSCLILEGPRMDAFDSKSSANTRISYS